MGRRRANPAQLDLFTADFPASPQVTAPQPRQEVKAGFGGSSDATAEILADIHDDRFGRLDDSDRIVYLDGEGRCRHASEDDANAVEHLMSQRYAVLGSTTTARHGVIGKTVHRITLTPGGNRLRTRWSWLKKVGGSR